MGFFEAGGKAAKFDQPGATITGKITRPYREAQTTKYGTAEPDFWPDGSPKMQAIIDLQTDAREDGDDDGVRTLYVASTRQKRAITDAIKRSGAPDLEPGGTLTLRYTGNDPKSKNPANPAKMYAAEYVAPVKPAGSLAAPAAAEPQYVTPVQPAFPGQVVPAVQAPTATASGLSLADEQKARDLFKLGLDDATVSAALGANLAMVGAVRAAA